MKKLNREVFAKNASRFFLVVMSFMLILSLCSMSAITTTFVIPSGTYTFLDEPFNDSLAVQFPFTSLEYDVNISVYIDDILYNGNSLLFSYYETEEYTDNNISITTDFDILFEYGVTNDLYTDGFLNGWNRQIIVNEPCPCTELEYRYFMSIVDAPAPRIMSVWSSITNWVISSLNTVQGVFYCPGEEVIAPDTSSPDVITYEGVSFYPIDLFSVSEAGVGRVFFNGTEIFFDDLSQTDTIINGQQYSVVSNVGVPIMLINATTGFYSPVGYEIIVQSDGGLTLLGSLSVIGLSISLAFLVIGVISRFLKLRG